MAAAGISRSRGRWVTYYPGLHTRERSKRFCRDGMMVFFNDPVLMPDARTAGSQDERCNARAPRARGRNVAQNAGIDLSLGVASLKGCRNDRAVGCEAPGTTVRLARWTNLAATLFVDGKVRQT